MTRALASLLLVAALGCDQDSGKTAAAPRSDEAVIGAWKKGGLEVSAMTTIDASPYSAVSCRGGTVSGVDVVLCTYDSGEDATAAEDLGLATIGGATGASIAHGPRLLVVADRRKADPSGRTIDALIKAFKG